MPMQNHIHLSTTLGGAPENAPDLLWYAYRNDPEPEITFSINRSITGKLLFHALGGDTPVIFEIHRLTIFVEPTATHTTKERLDMLRAMLGKRVYFCDNEHADDGTDHTADVQQFVFTKIRPKAMDNLRTRYQVDINLEDDNQ